MEPVANINGALKPLSEIEVPVLDRGFMFGDGAYEVIRVYSGTPFLFKEHLTRLGRSLDALRIGPVDLSKIENNCLETLQASNVAEATIYVQITRGVAATRSHAFPQASSIGMPEPEQANPFEDSFPPSWVKPTEFIYVMAFEDPHAERRTKGCSAITYPDLRWARCDIKSTNLLGNVFAAQAAKEGGVYEAILVNSAGKVTEGSHTNVFAVIDGTLSTAPLNMNILPGITRALILRLAKEAETPTKEDAFTKPELASANEVFLTGTTTEVLPVVTIDGQDIANGKPGALSQSILARYRDLVSKHCQE